MNLSAQITEKDIAYDSVAMQSNRDLGRAGFDSTATNGFYIPDSRVSACSSNLDSDDGRGIALFVWKKSGEVKRI